METRPEIASIVELQDGMAIDGRHVSRIALARPTREDELAVGSRKLVNEGSSGFSAELVWAWLERLTGYRRQVLAELSIADGRRIIAELQVLLGRIQLQ